MERHPQVLALLVLPIGIGVAEDTRRLAKAVSDFGRPMAAAVIAGALSGVVCVVAATLAIRGNMRSARWRPAPPSGRRRVGWWPWVAGGWLVLLLTAAAWAHPRHAPDDRWPLTTPLGAAAVAHLVVVMVAVAILVAVFVLVLPVSVWRENRRRRRARGTAPPAAGGPGQVDHPESRFPGHG